MPKTLLRPFVLSFRNNLRLPGNRKKNLILLLIASVVMLCIFACFAMILGSMKDHPIYSAVIPTKIIQLLYYAFFVLLLISNTISAIGNTYTAENMNLFLQVPLSTVRLYFAKFLETLFETTLMFVIFGMPALAAYYFTLDVSSGFLQATILVSVFFVLIPTGLSFLSASVFVKIASHIWQRGLFLFLFLLSAGAWAVMQLTALLRDVELRRGGANAVIQLVDLFDNPNPAWLPSRWASDIIASFVGSPLIGGHEKMVLLFASAIGSTAIGFLAFDLSALRFRSSAQVHKRFNARNTILSTRGDLTRNVFSGITAVLPLNRQLRSVVLKDFTSLVRDKALALQLLMYAGIAAVYVILFRFMSSALNLAPIAFQVWQAFLSSVNILFAGLIMTALMTRLVYPSISLEGRAFWILLVAPIRIIELLRAKYWGWLPFTCLVGLSLLGAGHLAVRAGNNALIPAGVVGLALSIGLTGLSIGIGALFASFEWESPNQISMGLGTLVLLLASIVLVLVTSVPASLLVFLLLIPKIRLLLGAQASFCLMCTCVFLVLYVNFVAAEISCRRGARSLNEKTVK